MASFPEATPHGPLEEVFPDIFTVRGCIAGRGMVFPRTMTIVRQGGALTVFNSVRLSEEVEGDLLGLGTVANVVKLGPFHGLDDPYYVDRFSPTLWAPPGATHKGGLETDHELSADSSPLDDSIVFTFETTAERECAVCVDAGGGGGTLVTCDAITNLVDAEGSEGCEKIITAENGFLRRASIGIFWRNRMRTESGPPIIHDYQRLLELPFENLISAHGAPIFGDAKRDVIETLRYLYKVDIFLEE